MLKFVIDTNVFISSFFGGIPREIINLGKDGEADIKIISPREFIDQYKTGEPGIQFLKQIFLLSNIQKSEKRFKVVEQYIPVSIQERSETYKQKYLVPDFVFTEAACR